MRFPFVPRAWHNAAIARLTAERNQLAKDLAAAEKDLAATEAELAGVSEKYTDTAIVNDCLTEELVDIRAKLAASMDAESALARQLHELAQPIEYNGTLTKAADVLEEHDAHRKALADALGPQKYHLNWDELIGEVVHLNEAVTERTADVERLTVQLGASEERARQAVQGLRPDEWESRPIDGAPAVRRDTPSEELQRALDRCKELDERLAVAEGRPKQVAS